ncbi:MAG: VTT domain-containing protein [Myxococcota bacterium]|nr:VTT domain-containing protein [Myxococcota bacterium]
MATGITVLAFFGAAHLVGYTLDDYAHSMQNEPTWLVGIVGCALLITDVLLPVPSSVIMLALGTQLGVVWGTIFGSVGGLCATLVAFGIGRMSKSRVDAWVGEKEIQRAHRLIRHWGAIAIIISRPLPVLAESAAFVAGTTTMRWRTITWSASVGVIPIAALYSLTGAGIAELTGTHLVIMVTLAIACAVWVILKRIESAMP